MERGMMMTTSCSSDTNTQTTSPAVRNIKKLLIHSATLEPETYGHNAELFPAEAAHEKRTKTRCA